MNAWSRTRKRIILTIVLLIVAVLVGVPVYFLFHKTATCSDGFMNGDEGGVDCGGSCQRICSLQSLPLIIKGDPRVLTVATSTYEVVALLENPNTDAEIKHAHYTFSLYSGDSLVALKTITGETYIPRGDTFVIFEGPVTFEAGVVPTRATLEWDMATLVWEKNKSEFPVLKITDSTLSRLDTAPRLEVTVGNDTLQGASNVDLTALLYDAGGSIFAASKTFINTLEAGEETQAIFTWPRPFATEPIQVEVVQRLLPDQSYLK